MLGSDLGKSRLSQKIPVLRVAKERGADQRHDYTVEKAERPAAVRFGDQGERSAGL